MFPSEAVPERIGAYKVLRRLAGAGSADVYVGRMEGPRGFSRLCTLKLVPSTIEGDESFAAELEREAAICATLNHPAIQRVFDFFEHEKHLVLVLEHVEGTSLDRLLSQLNRRQKKLSDAAIAALGRELAGALAHAHAVKDDDRKPTPVIHRNLTPENVLIGWDGQVRLTGFGLGKILGRTPDTVIGVIKGAPGFMAPEQSRGERVTPKADVYALGLLLWSLFSGQKPPEDGTREPPLVMLRPDLFKPLALAIDRALEPVPDKRGVSCQEIEALLSKVPGADKGREEIAEKALLLRGSRTAATESEIRPKTTTGPTRAPTPRPQRRVSLAQVRPGKPVASSKKKLSVPPPASRPSSERPSQRPTPPSTILDEEGPASVFPILRALAEHVPKPGGAIPGMPRLPEIKTPEKPKTPAPAPVAPTAKPKTVTPIGIGLSAPNEWKESVPDEDALDRFFDDAGFEADATKTPAPTKPAPKTTTPTKDADARISEPPRSNRKKKPAGRHMELDDTIPGMALVPEDAPAAPNPSRIAPPRLTPTPAPAATPIAPPMTAASVFTSPTPPPVRFGAPPKTIATTPSPQAVAPPNPVRFGPPPGATAPAAEVTNLRVTTQLAPRPYGGKTKSLKPTAASLAVVGGIACMVTAAIVMIVGRPATETTPDAAVSTAAPAPPPPPASPTPTTPKAPPPPPPPPAGSGYLTVEFPGEGVVYVSGKKLGRTNQMLLVPCGSKFVRVSTTAEGRYPEWLSPGETVDVPCLGSTKFSTSPNAPKPLPRRKR